MRTSITTDTRRRRQKECKYCRCTTDQLFLDKWHRWLASRAFGWLSSHASFTSHRKYSQHHIFQQPYLLLQQLRHPGVLPVFSAVASVRLCLEWLTSDVVELWKGSSSPSVLHVLHRVLQFCIFRRLVDHLFCLGVRHRKHRRHIGLDLFVMWLNAFSWGLVSQEHRRNSPVYNNYWDKAETDIDQWLIIISRPWFFYTV